MWAQSQQAAGRRSSMSNGITGTGSIASTGGKRLDEHVVTFKGTMVAEQTTFAVPNDGAPLVGGGVHGLQPHISNQALRKMLLQRYALPDPPPSLLLTSTYERLDGSNNKGPYYYPSTYGSLSQNQHSIVPFDLSPFLGGPSTNDIMGTTPFTTYNMITNNDISSSIRQCIRAQALLDRSRTSVASATGGGGSMYHDRQNLTTIAAPNGSIFHHYNNPTTTTSNAARTSQMDAYYTRHRGGMSNGASPISIVPFTITPSKQHYTIARFPCPLSSPADEMCLSQHQTFLRTNIEVFAATKHDTMIHTRGRTKPIQLGQVGIRCRHCAHIPLHRRCKGSTYFPCSVHGFYQAAQNMSCTHLQCGTCPEMSDSTKAHFAHMLETKHVGSTSGAGRSYWTAQMKQLGLVDTEQGVFPSHAIPTGVNLVDPRTSKPLYQATTSAATKRQQRNAK